MPDISGNWHFESGDNERSDYLLIRQDGDHFAVERTDPAMPVFSPDDLMAGQGPTGDRVTVYDDDHFYMGSLMAEALIEALETAAPNWAALRADIEAGLVTPDMDISPYVLDAMRLIASARELAAAE